MGSGGQRPVRHRAQADRNEGVSELLGEALSLSVNRHDRQKRASTARIKKNAHYHFVLLMVILLAHVTGCSYQQSTPENGQISVQAVSWTLVKKLAEPNAGLSGHKVTILNPVDRSVIASGTTGNSGIIEF
jgi:hypothetical protein